MTKQQILAYLQTRGLTLMQVAEKWAIEQIDKDNPKPRGYIGPSLKIDQYLENKYGIRQ